MGQGSEGLLCNRGGQGPKSGAQPFPVNRPNVASPIGEKQQQPLPESRGEVVWIQFFDQTLVNQIRVFTTLPGKSLSRILSSSLAFEIAIKMRASNFFGPMCPESAFTKNLAIATLSQKAGASTPESLEANGASAEGMSTASLNTLSH